MRTLPFPALMVAIGAGLAAALLFASLIGGGPLALPLFVLAPLPLAIAALGWGSVTGLMAVLVALPAIGFGLAWPAAIAFLLMVGLPIPVACHLVGLARPGEGGLEWYPIGRVLLALALLISAGTVVGGWAIGFVPEEVARETAEAARTMTGATGDQAAQVETLVGLTVRLMPFVFPASWLVTSAFELWLAAKIVARSGRLARPPEDFAARLEVPASAGAVFLGAIGTSFLDGGFGAIGAVISGVLFAVHFLVGLAVLHVATRGSDFRMVILAFAWTVIVLFTLPAAVVTLAGLIEPFAHIRRRRVPPGGRL